ncbi:uncharacterized protein LOC135346234 isoform X2 [Halichondria panicea]|uniref:uncharacterized protein LOC135346234 isoform X2 n=1 Tax=Halichondria panicea TaxID=6063 RepID=UPI00312B8252
MSIPSCKIILLVLVSWTLLANQLGSEQPCDLSPFTIIMISDNTGSTVSSIVHIPVTEALDGTLVECFAGGGTLSPQVGNTTLNVIDLNMSSVTSWIANLRTDALGSVLDWDPLDQPYQRCVTGYSITLNETVYNTTNTSLSLAGESLPYCETQTVTVKPLTLNGPLSSDTLNITVINPNLVTPAVSTSFIFQKEVLKLKVIVQDISIEIALIQMFGYISSGEDCVPTTSFNGSSVVIDFSDQSPGDTCTVCVMFRNKDCSAINSTAVTVPATVISAQEVTPSETNYTLCLSLPFTGYPPSDLLIVSILSPPHSDTITLPFPSTTNQIMVTFTDLTAGVLYTYTIRIVLTSDQSNDVVPPFTGEFSLTTLGGGGGGESTFPVAVVAGSIGGIAVLFFSIIIIIIVIVITRRRTNDLYFKEIAHQETPCVIKEESDYAVPQDLKYRGSRLSNVHMGDNFLQCRSPTPKSFSPNISDEGIYSLVFDALPNGTPQTVVSGKNNVL